jgi:elongation factor P
VPGAIIVKNLLSLHHKIIIMSPFLMVCLLQLLLVGFSSAFVSQSRPAFSRPISSLDVAVDTANIKNGMTLEIDKEPYKVISFSIMKQARGAAKTTIKFKNLIRGTTIENTYRSGEKFETALIEKKEAQFTFMEGVRSACKCICT